MRAGFDERKGCGGKAEREWIPGHKCENDREPGKGRALEEEVGILTSATVFSSSEI